MGRRRFPRAPRRTRGRRPSRSRYGRRRSGGTLGWIILLAIIAGATWFMWPRIKGFMNRAPSAPDMPTDLAALDDSVNAAQRRRDWDASLFWAQKIVEGNPQLSGAHRKLAAQWHNYAIGTREGADRPPLRTSLDRQRYAAQALAAADSAMKLAQSVEDWAAAGVWYGRVLEYAGLPLEALALYASILDRKPDDAFALSRAEYLRERLLKPRTPG